MTLSYRAVGWNRQKRLYDAWLAAGIAAYLAVFVGVGAVAFPQATIETLLIRGLGTAGLLLLHVVLSIGPLCRLDPRFLPLLYNRRHLGVATFLLGLAHGGFATVQFHAFGDVNPFVSLLTANPRWASVSQFPFEILGLAALAILFLMAATSHDFWLANLTAPVWKALHMLVYAAYALLVLHVALGVLQSERNPLNAAILGLGVAWVLGVHLAAALRERRADAPRRATADAAFVDACAVDEIPEKRARVVCLSGERVAVFRYDGKISALSSVCQHQNGPLGEGRIVDGCVTCPWHGYQYLPDSGASPPPFHEKVPTFRVRVEAGRVLVDPRPCPPGTRIEPARVPDAGAATRAPARDDGGPFYVGYQPKAPAALAARMRLVVACALATGTLLAAVLVTAQSPPGPGVHEYGVRRSFRGTLLERPVPALLVARPGAGESGGVPFSTYPLVAPFKHGAGDLVRGRGGSRIALEGTLVHRDGWTMIEIAPGSIRQDPTAGLAIPEVEDLGIHALAGEIVDGKCYLGVMKPARGKPHRACAARCLSGGIPPLFVARDVAGRVAHFLAVGSDGRPVGRDLLDIVAEPVEVRGRVERRGDVLFLLADRTGYRRASRPPRED